MDLGISGKIALVMGASKGIGRAIAEELINEGVKTVICARGKESLEATAKEIGAIPFQVDLLKPGAAAHLVQDVKEKVGPLNILIVNTGGPPPTTFDTTTDDQWQDGFQTLLLSSIDAIREALPSMKEQKWGRIGFITSVAAKEPVSNLIISNTLRAGVHGLVNSISKEYASFGININAVMPGLALTERLTVSLTKLGRSVEQMAEAVPAKRVGDPRELAALMAFLVSDRASYITGQAIACDGGLSQSI